jgi:hypothetical protein
MALRNNKKSVAWAAYEPFVKTQSDKSDKLMSTQAQTDKDDTPYDCSQEWADCGPKPYCYYGSYSYNKNLCCKTPFASRAGCRPKETPKTRAEYACMRRHPKPAPAHLSDYEAQKMCSENGYGYYERACLRDIDVTVNATSEANAKFACNERPECKDMCIGTPVGKTEPTD